jgi:hypothetical protein
VSHEKRYGVVVSVDLSMPFTKNSTLDTSILSVALAVTETVPLTVVLLPGAVKETVGYSGTLTMFE